MSTEKEDVSAHRVTAEEVSKRAQKQLRDLREELADAQKKEMEASQKYKERVSRGSSVCKAPRCLSFTLMCVCSEEFLFETAIISSCCKFEEDRRRAVIPGAAAQSGCSVN